MEAAVAASASPLAAAARWRVVNSQFQGSQDRHSSLLFLKSHQRRSFTVHSIKRLGIECFGEPSKLTSYWDNFKVHLWDASPKSLKEFQWEKGKDIVRERLLVLGQNAFKWSFVAWFSVSFVSDVFLAITRNREIMLPIGLFIGVILADFFKECTQELFQRGMKDGSLSKHLLAIGSFFVLVKLTSAYLKMQGQTLLSNIGNGGLMQVLWLAKNLQLDENNTGQEEFIAGASVSC